MMEKFWRNRKNWNKEKRNDMIRKSAFFLSMTAIMMAGILFWMNGAVVFASYNATVSTTSAKVRSSADTTGSVVSGLKSGDTVEVIEEVTGSDGSKWSKIYVDASTTGYIRSDLLKKSTTSTTSSAAAATGKTGDTVVLGLLPALLQQQK